MIRTGRVLGVDLGSRRIGIAITDADQTVAVGVKTLERSRDRATDHQALASLVSDYGAVGVVVGVPLSMSGSTERAAREVMAEVSEISDVVGVDVVTMDERLTTVAASGALRAAGRSARAQRSVIDQTAAAMLLQTWVDRRRADSEATRD